MKKKNLFFLCALVILGLPLRTLAADPPQYAFIPNIGDASVSKVDVVTNTAVARYYTVPRYGQVMGAAMAAIFGVPAGPFPVSPSDWRSARIAIDPEGNAWVLNTGSDCFVDGVEKAYLNGLPIQGTLVRIQSETAGLANSSRGHEDILTFGTDQAVEVYKVGAPNEIPRLVKFDRQGNLWIGFHMAAPKQWGYFQKYNYDKCKKTLTPAGGIVTSTVYDIAPYNGDIDKNGVLWFASSGSSNLGRATGPYAADHGMYSFDMDGPGAPVVTYYPGMTTAYGVLVDNTPAGSHVKVYATCLDGGAQMWFRDSTVGGSFIPVPVSGGFGLRGLAFDRYGRIWIASSGNGLVCWYNPALGTSGHSGGVGSTPVGVGIDDAGDMWIPVRESNKLVTFTPPAPPLEPMNGFSDFIDVPVGPRPYGYGKFTGMPVAYEISGYKYKAGTCPKLGLAGWTINLYQKDGDFYPPTPTASTVTDATGHYRFTNLTAGEYKVTEELQTGWYQVFPATNEHLVILPDSDPCNPVELSYDFENAQTACFDETAWGAQWGAGTNRFLTSPGNWATYMVYNRGDGTPANPRKFKLFAGQTYFVGHLLVYDSNGYLYLKYNIVAAGNPQQTYKPGYCPAGGWKMTEYHFQVVDEFYGFNPYRTKDGQGNLGSPVPGRFSNNGVPVGDGWFKVPIGTYKDSPRDAGSVVDAFIAAHAVMEWCGYPCSR